VATADVRQRMVTAGQVAVELAGAVDDASRASSDLAAEAARLRTIVERLHL
jgi:methyl-accepting chemotaxis protein